MCPKPKHLKHFIFEVLVGDLGDVEEFFVETCWLEKVAFEKFEGKGLGESLLSSSFEDL